VGTLVVFVWRGAWTILDLYLYPHQQDCSAWASMVSSYTTSTMFLFLWIWINLAFYYTLSSIFFPLDQSTRYHHVSLNKDRHNLVRTLVVTRQE